MVRKVVENKEGTTKRAHPSVFSSIRSVFAYAQPADYWLMTLGFIGAVGDGFSMPVMLTIMSKTVNNLAAGPSSPNFMHSINQNSLYLVYLAMGCLVVSFFEGYCWTRTGERQASSMRAQYLKAVLRQDVGFFDLNFASTNEVITSVSNDSLVIQDVLSEKVPNFIMNISTFFGSYVAAFILLWRLAAVALPTVVLLLIPGLIYGKVLLDLSRKIQIEYEKAGVVAEQAFSGIRTVYAFTAERQTIAAFSAAIETSVLLGRKQGLAKGVAFGSNGITFSIWAFMLWYSSRLVMDRGAEGGTVFAVGACIIIGGLAFGASLSNSKYFAEAMAAAERIGKVVARRPPIDSESDEGMVIAGSVVGEVEFKNVRFCYPVDNGAVRTEVLKEFSLRVEGGKTVALVGGSGCGKSTAVGLLQRFYDVGGGEIAVDGVDVRRLRLKWLRGKMGMVSQEPAMFATTIKENILFGKETATIEEVVAAAVTANAHGFISELPMGYDTQVGERGVQLSGGQKQRLAIARAVVRKPAILLLDEATSALDFKSEQIVQEALDAATVGRTTIIIAHRLSAIRNADNIAFIHAGRVAEFGSHDQLLRDLPDGHYAALFRAQQSQPPLSDHLSAASTGCSSRTTSRRFSPSSPACPPDEKPSSGDRGKPSMRRLLMMNAPEWRQAVVGCGAAALFGGVQPAYSYVMGSVIMVFFIKDEEEMKEKIREYALIFVGLTIFSVVVNVLQHYNLGVMGECLTRRVRERMMSKMLTFEVAWFDQEENSTGALCSRLAKDATMVRSLVGDRMSLLIQALSAVTVACVLGLVIAWRLALLMIATQPITILCFYAQRVLLTSLSHKSLLSQSESSKLAGEAVGNHRTITSFSSQSRILRLFHLAQSLPRRQNLKLSYLAGAGLSLSKSLTTSIWSLAFFYSGHLLLHHRLSPESLLQTFLIIASTGRVIADAATLNLAPAAQSISSVFAILDRIPAIDPADPDARRPATIAGAIEFLDVDFRYQARTNSPVLKRFNLSIAAGKSTALVGASGSGKSTVVSLIQRFYDPVRGAVTIDGRDIRSYHLRSLRRHIAVVAQEPVLFVGTVRENIAYGAGDVGDAEVEAAARAAGAHEFIAGMRDGYGTWCGERGAGLSGGQKQRVAIARAVLRNPAIMLLDEATSAVDGETERMVQAALERVMMGRTTVVVAHRLNTIRNCDVIAVMNNGVIVEKGSHESLMAIGPKGVYYGLVSIQQDYSRKPLDNHTLR